MPESKGRTKGKRRGWTPPPTPTNTSSWFFHRIESVEDGLNRTLIGSHKELIERIKRYQDVGVSHIEMKMPDANIDSLLGMMRRFCDEVRPVFA